MGGGLSKVDLTPVYKEISQASLAANQIFHSAVFYDLLRTEKVSYFFSSFAYFYSNSEKKKKTYFIRKSL